jgi:chromosome segregation ATPase
MNFTTSTYRQNRQIAALVDKLSKETGVEKSVVLHFLYTDLERIYNNKIQVHTASLKSTETEFRDLLFKEQQLIKAIDKKDADFKTAQSHITQLTADFEQKTNQLSYVQNQLTELRSKLKDLSSNLAGLEKEKKQVEYKKMMKIHSIKEKSDFSFKKLGWILTAFTIIAIIIAIILILNK